MAISFLLFSIGGGILLFGYALYIRDPVFILGQGFGVFVYARNLYFELRDHRRGGGPGGGKGRSCEPLRNSLPTASAECPTFLTASDRRSFETPNLSAQYWTSC